MAMNIFTQFFKKRANNPAKREQEILQDLMRREAKLNSDIFGTVPAGVKRDFFCLDKSTWIWYEEWTDNVGQKQNITTRYVIRPTEILKSRDGGAYNRLTMDEAINFQKATAKYAKKVKTHLYSTKQPTKV